MGLSKTWPNPALLVLAACGTVERAEPNPPPPPPPVASDTALIEVDNSTTYQTVRGFGGTTWTLVFPNGDHLGPYRAAAIEAAFGDVGISVGMLSIGLVETPLDATDPWTQRGNDNNDPSIIAEAGFNFTGSDILRDAILTPASAYGYDRLELGPLIDLRGPLNWLQPIRATDYQRYLDEVAEHVLAVVRHWRDAYGLSPQLLHLFNEPTSGNGELVSTSVQEVVDIVERAGNRLRDAGFASVKFVVPNEETIGRSLDVARAILADPGARPYVGAIGYHAYPYGSVYASPARILATSGSGSPDQETRQLLGQLKTLGEQNDVPIWLTEVSEGPGNTDFGFDAIENVLARAIHIHDNFAYAGASAFFGMITIWDSQTHAEHFAGRDVPFLSEQSGMVLVDAGTGQIMITGMGYAVGQYARWIGREAVRIGATSGSARVIVTAFRNQTDGRIVVVAVNNESTEQLLRIALKGASSAGAASGELSYQGLRWQAIPPFTPSNGTEITYVAPARSVVTLAIPLR